MQDNNSAVDGVSGGQAPVNSSSNRMALLRTDQRAETSQIAELSASLPPNMQSNFRRQRGYLDVNRLLHAPNFNRTPQLPEGAQDQPSSTGLINRDLAGANDMSSNTQVIWGTNINAGEVSNKLKNFIHTYVEMDDNDDDADEDMQYEKKPYYIEKIKENREMEEYVLEVDCDHIWQYDRGLYRQIVDYPSDIIPIFDLVVSQVYMELFSYGVGGAGQGTNDQREGEEVEEDDHCLQVRPFNLRQTYRIREIDPVSIDKLIQLKGIVIRCSDVIPEMKEADFVCFKCGREQQSYIERGRINEPTLCQTCYTRNSFSIQHNQCIFSDKQHVKIQETPESVPEGETPQTIHLCAYEDLVDYVRPGDRVEITGIYKAMGVRVNPNKRTLKNVYRTYVDVMNYKKGSKGRIDVGDKGEDQREAQQAEDVEMNQIDTGRKNQRCIDVAGDLRGQDKDGEQSFTTEDIEKMRAFALREDAYELLTDALAPSIWENSDVKKGILCQLFGGVSKECANGQGRMRGEINVLLCGDPSTAKSQLLQYVHKLAPRGIYTSGKGSSAVGLTVYITKDPETKELVLESGALVLSDRGICCIDEFDKMDENTRVILHEAMEQQTVSVAKAGIICTLNARTAILAAANPVHSKYDPKLSVVDNIRLPPTLLSRFDLIYLILDKQSEAHDRRLANHIVSLFSRPEKAVEASAQEEQRTNLVASKDAGITKAFLANYISYARKHVHPTIPESLVKHLVQEYMNMRSTGNSRKTITATPRQLDSMIRIAESIAKMKLQDEVTMENLEESIRLIKTAMQQSATDPQTGEIDMGMINTGTSASSAERVTAICDFVKRVNNDHKEKIRAHGLKYHNLWDYLTAKAKDGKLGTNNDIVRETEFQHALMILEEDGIITQVGHKSAPTIRFMDM